MTGDRGQVKDKPKKVKVLLIDWLDSCSSHGWKNSNEVECEVSRCQSVGFLVAENEVCIVLALNRTTQAGYKPFGDLITIPRPAIIRKRLLMTLIETK